MKFQIALRLFLCGASVGSLSWPGLLLKRFNRCVELVQLYLEPHVVALIRLHLHEELLIDGSLLF